MVRDTNDKELDNAIQYADGIVGDLDDAGCKVPDSLRQLWSTKHEQLASWLRELRDRRRA